MPAALRRGPSCTFEKMLRWRPAIPVDSTTRSLEVATSRFGQNGVVAIDLSRVGSPIVDLTRGIPGIGPNTMLSRWAINAQEVLIQGRIPAEAIVPLP